MKKLFGFRGNLQNKAVCLAGSGCGIRGATCVRPDSLVNECRNEINFIIFDYLATLSGFRIFCGTSTGNETETLLACKEMLF